MTSDVQYLTAKGFEEVKKEFQDIKDLRIPEIAARIDEAKQQGDLSENAEYHQAKEDMAWAQGRLRELQYILDHAEVVDDAVKKQGIVIVGSTIVVKCGEKTKEFTIVGPHEADPINGKISNESPIGASFLSHHTGEKVSIDTPAGTQIYEILDVK